MARRSTSAPDAAPDAVADTLSPVPRKPRARKAPAAPVEVPAAPVEAPVKPAEPVPVKPALIPIQRVPVAPVSPLPTSAPSVPAVLVLPRWIPESVATPVRAAVHDAEVAAAEAAPTVPLAALARAVRVALHAMLVSVAQSMRADPGAWVDFVTSRLGGVFGPLARRVLRRLVEPVAAALVAIAESILTPGRHKART